MNYQIRDKKYPSRLVLIGSRELQFRNFEANADPAIAYRISRMYQTDYEIRNLLDAVPYNPDRWRKDKSIIWSCNYSAANGYGMVAENTAKFMIKSGHMVYNPGSITTRLEMGGEHVDPSVIPTLSEDIYPDMIEVQHCQPPAFRQGIVQRKWLYTMYESTNTPKRWIEIANTADHVLVPSKWLVDSWKESGLTVPISVYRHGVDTDYYHYQERPVRDKFTFLHYALLHPRKGSDLLVQAFNDEFKRNEPVKLIMKNTIPFFPYKRDNPNVESISATYSKEKMRQMLWDADCFVFPTRGEGFGLPPLEAMATGLPTIVTGWSGPADYVDPNDTIVLGYKMVPAYEMGQIYKAEYDKDESYGEWAEPNYEQLRTSMRWVFEHRDKAMEMGKAASERIAGFWTWEHAVSDLVAILNANA